MSNVSYYQQSSVNKLGIAAPTGSLLDLQGEESEQTEEELRRKQQVQEFVSKLTPEQVVLQQKRIQVLIRTSINASHSLISDVSILSWILILIYRSTSPSRWRSKV